MPEVIRTKENVELEVYRNTPFEFDATAETAGLRVNVVTTTVTRPEGSWVLVEPSGHQTVPTNTLQPSSRCTL
jgi:hypothetical protein